MTFLWQLIRIEILRKWNIIAILIALWLFVCFAFWIGIRSMYGPVSLRDYADVCGPVALSLPFLYAAAFGAALFHSGEKNGVRFFLYHHPISRVRVYLIRYLTGLALVAALSVMTILSTPRLFSMTWADIAKTTSGDVYAIMALLSVLYLLVYSTTAFFSPLFDSDLTTIPVAIIYAGAVAILTAWFAALFPMEQDVSVTNFRLAWIVGSVALFLTGWRLYVKRWILEYSWTRRSLLAAAFFAVSVVVLLAINFVDPVDLLYLMGVDLMAL